MKGSAGDGEQVLHRKPKMLPEDRRCVREGRFGRCKDDRVENSHLCWKHLVGDILKGKDSAHIPQGFQMKENGTEQPPEASLLLEELCITEGDGESIPIEHGSQKRKKRLRRKSRDLDNAFRIRGSVSVDREDKIYLRKRKRIQDPSDWCLLQETVMPRQVNNLLAPGSSSWRRSSSRKSEGKADNTRRLRETKKIEDSRQRDQVSSNKMKLDSDIVPVGRSKQGVECGVSGAGNFANEACSVNSKPVRVFRRLRRRLPLAEDTRIEKTDQLCSFSSKTRNLKKSIVKEDILDEGNVNLHQSSLAPASRSGLSKTPKMKRNQVLDGKMEHTENLPQNIEHLEEEMVVEGHKPALRRSSRVCVRKSLMHKPAAKIKVPRTSSEESNMCHQCQRNDKGEIVRCTGCKRKRYCVPCIKRWS